MKQKLGLYILFLFTFSTLSMAYVSKAQNSPNPAMGKVKVAVLVNGDACNINWDKKLPQFEVLQPGLRAFIATQNLWELDKRLLQYKPAYCLIYAGLPDVLLRQPLAEIMGGYKSLCKKMVENGITPIIIRTLPVAGHSAVNAQLQLLNSSLSAYAVDSGVYCFDAGAGLVSDSVLKQAFTTDGFSLTEQGLNIFAKNVTNYMDELLLWKAGKLLPKATAYNLLKDNVEKILAASPKKVKVVMLGNSLTQGGGDWGQRLGRTDVRNTGIGGYTSGQMLWHLDTVVVAAKPEVCFIMAGVNDLFNHIPLEIIHKNQVAIIQKLLAHKIRPVVQLTLYVNRNPELNQKIKTLNEQLKSYCTKNNIACLDLNPLLADADGLKAAYTTDGTHLKESAYAIWVAEINKFLR